MTMQDFDSRTPKLVTHLLRCSREYTWNPTKYFEETYRYSHSHHIFTFKYRPGWRIDAYDWYIVTITTPWNEVVFRWFKTGHEYDCWTGTVDHCIIWSDICDATGWFTEEVDKNGYRGRYLAPTPEYIEGCPCIECNKEDYDGLVLEVKDEWLLGK